MTGPIIAGVHGRRVWDSRGRPTVEAEITLSDGTVARGIAPAGASTGSLEAVDLRDGGHALAGFDVTRAVRNVTDVIAPLLMGMDPGEQQLIDQIMIDADGTPYKSRLGGNAIIAVSTAALHAAAVSRGLPLWKYLAGDRKVRIPLPQIQILGGGVHAGRRIDIQDIMAVPLGAESFGSALEMVAEVYRSAGNLLETAGKRFGLADEGGWWPAFESNEEALEMMVRAIEAAGFRSGEDIGIALDIAASAFGTRGQYRLGLEGRELVSEELIEMLGSWIDRYPLVSVEDPLAEDDAEGLRSFTERYGDRIQIVGDDFLVTNADRIADAAQAGICNTALIKPNQAGTVTETVAALDAARAAGWRTIVSARSGETEDVTIAHMAVGWDAGQLKVGSFARSERMAKWNEVLRIAEALGEESELGRL